MLILKLHSYILLAKKICIFRTTSFVLLSSHRAVAPQNLIVMARPASYATDDQPGGFWVCLVSILSVVKMVLFSILLSVAMLLYFYTNIVVGLVDTSTVAGFGTYLPFVVFGAACLGLLFEITGFVAALFRTRFIFKVYAIVSIVLAVVFLVPLIFFAIATYYGCSGDDSLRDKVSSRWENEYNSSSSQVSAILNVVESRFECCGFDSYKEFGQYGNGYWRTECESYTGYECAVPSSCCKKTEDVLLQKCVQGRPGAPKQPDLIFQDGCYDALMSSLCLIGGIGLAIPGGLLIIQIICIVAGFKA